jgi:hypothetical protein
LDWKGLIHVICGEAEPTDKSDTLSFTLQEREDMKYPSCMYKAVIYYLFFAFNLLNTELNPMCHLLILLGDLTFLGKSIVSISNKMQRYTVYLYLETALHVSGGTSTHHQERTQLYRQHLVFVTPLVLSAAIVEELEPV